MRPSIPSRLAAGLLALGALAASLGPGPARAIPDLDRRRPPAPSPREIAHAWWDAVSGAKVSQAMALSFVPFWWDGRDRLEDASDLEARYVDVARRRGVRTLVPDKVEELEGADVSDHDRFCGVGRSGRVFLFFLGRESVGICIRDAKVIGFDD